MKVSKAWLKQLVNLKVDFDEVTRLLPLHTIAIKEFADEYFELDMKGYNRADLLSMRGVAYEVAAITDSKVTFEEPGEDDFIWTNKQLPEVKVEVKNTTLAPLYCLAKIEGLKVEKSAPEWVQRLAESGVRTVNNIADVTNLVMLEYGQPLHAFDAQTVKEEKVIVRTAKDGEKLTTLDGKTRDLVNTDLLITDPEKAIGLAGVMGGKNSEVSEETQDILLEAAIFDSVNLRNTALRLGLTSEAGKRFQHGLTKKRLLQAFSAAIRMYESLGGKLTAITLRGNLKDKEKTLKITQKKTNDLIGIDVSREEIELSLKKLGFSLIKTEDGWEIKAPYWRLDINIEEDLIEEVARMYGYERIPSKPLSGELPAPIDQKLFHLLYDIKAELVNIGLTEVQTYSYISTDVLRNLEKRLEDLVKIGNPMSKETEYLRDELWPNLLRVAAENLKYRDDLAIFEVGKTYKPKIGSLPEESYKLAIAVSSNITESIQELFMIFLKAAEKFKFDFKPTEADGGELFHPARFAKIEHEDKKTGFIGEIHPRVTHRFGTDKRIAVLEIDVSSFSSGR